MNKKELDLKKIVEQSISKSLKQHGLLKEAEEKVPEPLPSGGIFDALPFLKNPKINFSTKQTAPNEALLKKAFSNIGGTTISEKIKNINSSLGIDVGPIELEKRAAAARGNVVYKNVSDIIANQNITEAYSSLVLINCLYFLSFHDPKVVGTLSEPLISALLGGQDVGFKNGIADISIKTKAVNPNVASVQDVQLKVLRDYAAATKTSGKAQADYTFKTPLVFRQIFTRFEKMPVEFIFLVILKRYTGEGDTGQLQYHFYEIPITKDNMLRFLFSDLKILNAQEIIGDGYFFPTRNTLIKQMEVVSANIKKLTKARDKLLGEITSLRKLKGKEQEITQKQKSAKDIDIKIKDNRTRENKFKEIISTIDKPLKSEINLQDKDAASKIWKVIHDTEQEIRSDPDRKEIYNTALDISGGVKKTEMLEEAEDTKSSNLAAVTTKIGQNPLDTWADLVAESENKESLWKGAIVLDKDFFESKLKSSNASLATQLKNLLLPLNDALMKTNNYFASDKLEEKINSLTSAKQNSETFTKNAMSVLQSTQPLQENLNLTDEAAIVMEMLQRMEE